jgi:hypothetical protein
VLSALLATAFAAPAAHASAPTFKGASADGEVVFFETDEQLVPGDTDSRRDVYERAFDPTVTLEGGGEGAYVTREVSTGPTGGNDAYHAQFEGASGDGRWVYFSTDESLVAADTDRKADVYARDRESGATVLVSQGASACAPGCGNGAVDAGFATVDSSGDEVFFVSEESLVAADTDSAVDIYVRDLAAETTTLVSAAGASCSGSCGNGSANAVMWGVSADGSTAFFTTAEALSTADSDSATDIYARDLEAATTTLVSQKDAACGGCVNQGAVPVFRRSSADGSRAFFITNEPLTAADTDPATDVYARDLPGGPTTLVSAGGSADTTANFAAADAAGEHVFFNTSEALVGGDTNGANDVYEWTAPGGSSSLITSGKGGGATFNAALGSSAVFFTTTEQLVLADTDASADVYAQEVGGGEPALLTHGDVACQPGCGNGASPAIYDAIAAGGARVFFTTTESLTAADGDANADIYVHDSGDDSTTLSTVPGYCPIPAKDGGCPVVFGGVSSGGDHVFFQTPERLSLEDNDSEADVYERAYDEDLEEEVTRLVSVGNSPDLELGPATPVLEATDPESPNASTTPSIVGQADPGTSIKLYTEPNCTGVVAQTGSAAELSGAGIQVSVAAGTTTTFWANSTDIHGDTSACSNSIPYKQESPAPPPGEEGGGGEPSGGESGGDTSGDGGPTTSGSGGTSGGTTPTHDGIAYVTPLTRITFGPAFKTRVSRPVFRFTDATGQPGTTFICRIDRRRWTRCGSPTRLKRLGRGRHVFRVKARNAVGTWEARPAARRFKLVGGKGGRRNHRRHRRGAHR